MFVTQDNKSETIPEEKYSTPINIFPSTNPVYTDQKPMIADFQENNQAMRLLIKIILD